MSIKRQFVWSVIPLAVVTVINLISVRLFYRYLGAEMYALWFYIGTLSGMFGFADLGLGVSVARYIAVALGKGDKAAVREYWGTGNLVALPLVGAIALVFAALGVVFGPKWFNVSPGNVTLLRWCFAVGALDLFCSYYGQLWNTVSQAHLDFRFVSLVKTTGALAILVSILLARLYHNTLLLVAWALAIDLIQLCIFIWHARRAYGLGFNLREACWPRAREMAGLTGKTFASLLLGSFFGSLDRVMLGKLAAPVDFTHYTIAANAGARIQGLSVAMMGPVAQNTSRNIGARGTSSAAEVFNHSFDFALGWFALVAVWATVWHPVLLRLWLGNDLALSVAPVFPALIVAFCLTAMSGMSGAQLAPLNRMGAALLFNSLTIGMVAVGVYAGWRLGGVIGVAYGFLFSRLGLLAQDLFVIRLIGGGGWLAKKTWVAIAAQVLVGAGFAASYLAAPHDSLWLIVPALLHGGLVAAWLLRHQLRKLMAGELSL